MKKNWDLSLQNSLSSGRVHHVTKYLMVSAIWIVQSKVEEVYLLSFLGLRYFFSRRINIFLINFKISKKIQKGLIEARGLPFPANLFPVV